MSAIRRNVEPASIAAGSFTCAVSDSGRKSHGIALVPAARFCRISLACLQHCLLPLKIKPVDKQSGHNKQGAGDERRKIE